MRFDGRLILDACMVAAGALAAWHSAEPETWRLFILSAWAWAALGFLRWYRYGYSVAEVAVLAVVLRAVFLVTPLTLSDDYFRYVWDGLLQHSGINPFLFQPESEALSRFQSQPVFQELNSADFFSVYPPLSQILFFGAGFFYDADFSANVLVLRLLFAGAELGAVILLLRTVAAPAAALYALHPLIVVELAGELHTESVMVFFLVLALWAWKRDRYRIMVAAVVFAGLLKLYPLFLLPFAVRRAGLRNSLPGLLAGAALCLPYAGIDAVRNMWASLDLYVRYFEFNAGPYYALKEIGYFLRGEDLSKIIGPDLRWLFFASLPVLFVLDYRRQWRFPAVVFTVLAVFFLLSTTIHPWYLAGVLAAGAWLSHPPYAWLFLGAASLGTYERYTGGFYWEVVGVSWVIFGLIALFAHRHALLGAVQRYRARRKAELVRPFLAGISRNGAPASLADIGAGEGFVGAELQSSLQAQVELIDVIDLNQTGLPHTTFDGTSLPHADGSFDAAMLVFVLHHAECPHRLLSEAGRVTKGPIIVVESVYRSEAHRRMLEVLDRWANRIRSGGKMADQEAHLHFRTADEWRAMFHGLGFRTRAEVTRGRFIHIQQVFVLESA